MINIGTVYLLIKDITISINGGSIFFDLCYLGF